MVLINVVILVATGIAVATDMTHGRIKNWLTIPLILSGLTFAAWQSGWSGVPAAMAAGVLYTFTTFQFTTPGGGDIKLTLGVGAWLGFGAWPAYFAGAWVTRAALGVLIRVKIYGGRDVLRGIWSEIRTGQVPRAGERNFASFRRAAALCGVDAGTVTVPGALWVAGGALAVFLTQLWGG